jgi:DNA-binding transcriptional regulator YdaS (Cro superfamily)
MDTTKSKAALTRAIAKWTTLKAFAAALDVEYQTVQQWLRNGVPAPYCPQIEEMTGGESRCEELNDSVNWAYLRTTAPQSTAAAPAAPDQLAAGPP